MPQLSHKIKLLPNKTALSYFKRASGISRFAYNWALATSTSAYKTSRTSLSGYDLVKIWNKIKHTEFPWSNEVSKWAPQKAIQDLGEAKSRFFQKKSKYPKFKKKGKSKDSFYLGLNSFKVTGKYLRIPKLDRPIKLAIPLRFKGKVMSAVISRSADEWFVSFSVKIPDDSFVYKHKCETQATVGVDVGVSTLATLSDGTKVTNPRSYRVQENKLKRAQKSVSRKKRRSSNRKKAILRLSRVHRKIARVRHDCGHKLTAFLVKNFRYIGIEDLNVKGMLKNRSLAKSIADASFYEFKRQLSYKTVLSGSSLVLADKFFPSSKTCSNCEEVKKDLVLSDRVWVCGKCATSHDRDVNAAKNLEKLARRHRKSLNACGEGIRPGVTCNSGQSLKKQESGTQAVN